MNDTIEKIEKELKEKLKIPKEKKQAIYREIFFNAIIAIFVMVYFLYVFLGANKGTVKNSNIQIYSLIYLAVSVIVFEIAYKKDSGKLAIRGIEALLVAIVTLFLPYIIFEVQEPTRKYFFMMGGYFGTYYAIKILVILIKNKSTHLKDTSDIEEIVKKEVVEKKERTKTPKKIEEQLEEKIVVEKPKKEIKKETQKETVEEKIVKTKKEEKPKVGKKETKKVKQEEMIETPKRRGRPKKEETKIEIKEEVKVEEKPKTKEVKKEVKPKEKSVKVEPKEEKQEEIVVAPKRRGRPKKEEIKVEEKTKTTKKAKKETVKPVEKIEEEPEVEIIIQEPEKVKQEEKQEAPKRRGRPRKAEK